MEKFIEEMRKKVEEVYKSKKPYFESKIKAAISESAERGDKIAMVCVQGSHDANIFERYVVEIKLNCERIYVNGSWYWYKVIF